MTYSIHRKVILINQIKKTIAAQTVTRVILNNIIYDLYEGLKENDLI